MTTFEQILTKIRQICETCYQGAQHSIKIPRNYKNLSISSSPAPPAKQIPQLILKEYLTCLQYLQQYIIQLRESNIQYSILQQSLQKQQLEIRKHIGIEQQLRLYTEGVKLQLEECEKEKLELLENSKVMIRGLKLKGEKVFEELEKVRSRLRDRERLVEEKEMQGSKLQHFQHNKHSKKKSHNSNVKTKLKDKSSSPSAERKDSSLNKIIKTEYIEREKHPFLNVNIRKQLKYNNNQKNEKHEALDKEKKHKHHKSTYVHNKSEEVQHSQSKKKNHQRMELLEKAKKDNKVKPKPNASKGFDLGTYLSKQQLKKSPNKNIERPSSKHPQTSSKRTEKHHKSSFNEKSEKPQKQRPSETSEIFSKQQANRQRPSSIHQSKQDAKQKSKSKQSKKKIKSQDKLKQKIKQPKKTFHQVKQQHNRSLFSVSSVEYRSSQRQHTTTEKLQGRRLYY